MECVNQELDQFLCLFVNERQDNWYNLLPIVEFQQPRLLHNATTSVSTRHGTNSPHGFQAGTEPLQPGDGQQIHQENRVCKRTPHT